MQILGIPGSLRAASLNQQLLRLAAEELPEGVELDVYDELAEIPPYDQDLDDLQPDAVERLKDAIAAADAILVATPEFNGSIPGQLKNAFDWVSRPRAESPIRSKPVAVIGASTGAFGGVWAQRELKKVLGIMGARVLDVELPVGKADRRLAEADDELRESLAAVAEALAEEVCGSSAEPAVPAARVARRAPRAADSAAPRVRDSRDAATMLLADFAQVSDGKLTIVGGGWSLTGPEPVPFGIAILIRVPWDQANQRHVMRLELLDADGHAVEVETDDGMQPVVFFDDVPFEVGRPAGLKPGTPLDFPVAVNSGPVLLEPGRYEWRLTIDGEADEEWRLPFSVRLEPEEPIV